MKNLFTEKVLLAFIAAVVALGTPIITYLTIKSSNKTDETKQKVEETIAKVDEIKEKTETAVANTDTIHKLLNSGLTVRVAEAETSGVRKGILQQIETQKEEDKEDKNN